MTADLWRGAEVPPLISSFSLAALEVARDLAPEIRRGVLFEAPPADWLAQLQRLQAVSLHCDADLLSDAVLAEARAHGVPVLCYTVNAPKNRQKSFLRAASAPCLPTASIFLRNSGAGGCEAGRFFS